MAGETEFRLLSVRRSPLLRSLSFYVWDYPFTRAGKLLIFAFFLSALPGAITDEVPMYCVPVSLLALVLVMSGMGSVFRWSRIKVQAQWPDRVAAGSPVSVRVQLTNAGWIPVYDLAVACFGPPPGWEFVRDEMTIATLRRGDSAGLTIQLIPWQRGVYRLPPVRAFSTFPFHLFRNEVGRAESATVLVLPKFHELTSMNLEISNRHQPGGVALTSHVGDSPEYIGNRDYMPGDALRRIDFRSWARLARPVVREYQDEYYCRIALVLDTFVAPRRRAGRKGFTDLEAAVSLTAAVSDAVSRGEALIDIFAAGPTLHVFQAGRHRANFENILEILAGVGPCRQDPFIEVAPVLAEELHRISTVVCILLDWNESRRMLVQRALEAGCHVKVLLVRVAKTDEETATAGVEIIQLTPAQVAAGIGTL